MFDAGGRMMLGTLACILFISVSIDGSISGSTLKFVNVLFRHGDRTPVAFYPNDPHKDLSNWPVGPGQLTPRGMNMQYELGRYLRKRYSGFLNNTYKRDDILVRSTDVDRTLMSALSNLAGLYPPKSAQIWNPDLLWQPIPVHTVPGNDDILLGSHFNCPKFVDLKNRTMYENPYFKALNTKYASVFAYISNHSGESIDSVMTSDWIRDTLFIEELYNKTLPPWTKSVYPSPLNELSAISFAAPTWTTELKRLKCGPLLTQLLDNFENAGDPKRPSFVMYSGHDTTIAALLNSLGVFPPQIPPYASVVIMEVHESSNGSLGVRFQYRNDTSRPPYDLTLPGCTPLCPLDSFKKLTNPIRLTVEEWQTECALGGSHNIDTIMFISILISSLFVIIMGLAVGYAVYRRVFRTRNDPGYVSINQVPH